RCRAWIDDAGTADPDARAPAGGGVPRAPPIANQRCGRGEGFAAAAGTVAGAARGASRAIAAGVAGADGDASVGSLRHH
ncbi:hypothetical protein ABTH33_20500, partial [Acinetobacter baumannii]